MKAKINRSNLKGLRREKRNPADLYFKIRALGEAGAEFHEVIARTVDISISGISFITFHTFPVGTEIEIRFDRDQVAKGLVVNSSNDPTAWDLLGMAKRMSLIRRNNLPKGLKDFFAMIKRIGVQIIEKTDSWPGNA